MLSHFWKKFLVLSFISVPAIAQAAIDVQDAWARASIGSRQMTAAYLVLKNESPETVKLVEVTTDIGRAEIHESLVEDGVMRMRERKEITLAAGESVHFKPGGLHIMLMDLKQPLTAGSTFQMSLKTSDNKTIPVTVQVRKP